MPQAAEDLAEDMYYRFIEEQAELVNIQRRLIERATLVQSLPKAMLTSQGPAEITRRMQVLQRITRQYFAKDFDPIYLAGARKVDPTFAIGAADRSFLAKLNLQEYQKLTAAMRNVRNESRRFAEMVWNDRQDRRKKLGIKYTHVDFVNAKPLPDELTGLTPRGVMAILAKNPSTGRDNSARTIRLRGIKAIQFRPGMRVDPGHEGRIKFDKVGKKYTLGDYGSMVVKTNASRAYNMGTLAAIKRKGLKYVSVTDGPECGWTAHGDGDLANGKVVTIEEARAYPIAHPNCKRAFHPASPEDTRREEEKRAREAAAGKILGETATQRALRIGVLSATGLLTAAAATNIGEAGFTRFVSSQFFNKIVERAAAVALKGDRIATVTLQRLNRLADLVEVGGEKVLASVTPIYPNGPTSLPSVPILDQVRYAGERFIQEPYIRTTEFVKTVGGGISKEIKTAIGALDETIEDKIGDKFQAAYHVAKRVAMSEDTGENLKRVIDMEAKRRGMFERVMDKLPGKPEIRASWSRWGPRAVIDLTSWVRAKVTATPTGLIRTLAVKPAGAVRGVFKMYQDGTLGGHISVIPKNFARGIFRAIVEVDEQGHLVGNLRLVPGGPLRLRLEFVTDAVKQDLKDFTISPIGAAANLAEQARKFKFNRAVLELRIFNQSAFEVAANLRLPVSDIKRAINAAKEVGKVVEAAGANKYTGTITHFIRNPEFVKKIFGKSKSSVFGNIKFSNLTKQALEQSKLLEIAKGLNVRLLTKAQLTSKGLQAIATNMRLHGWIVYDIGNVLKLRWRDVQVLINNGMARTVRFMEDLGVRKPEDLLPVWRERVAQAQLIVRRSPVAARGYGVNVAETIKRALEPIYLGATPGQANRYQIRALQTLIGSKSGDTVEQTYNKLRNMINFLRDQEWVEGNYIQGYADGITEAMMRAIAKDLTSRRRTLRVV